MQITQPMHFMGTIFREIDESQVNVEDLFFVVKQVPKVIERPDAVPYAPAGGEVEFQGVDYSFQKEGGIEE